MLKSPLRAYLVGGLSIAIAPRSVEKCNAQ